MSRKNTPIDLNVAFAKKALIVYAIIGIVVIGTLGFFSFSAKVDQTEYGLKQNWITGQVDTSRVYTAGRYFIGFENSMITFPRIQITIEFSGDSNSESDSIGGRTSDGLSMTLEISFQYQLIQNKVPDLFNTYGNGYQLIFIQRARDIIRDISSKYNAIEFFNNRTQIGADMGEQLAIELEKAFTLVPSFQLRQVDLPDAFENALERAEVARREIEIAKFEQEAALIKAETAILEAQAQANITIIEAQAEAEAFLTLINAQAEAVNISLTAQKEAYYALSQALNLTSSELLAYLWIQALTDIGENGNMVIIGENTPMIVVNPPADNSTTF